MTRGHVAFINISDGGVPKHPIPEGRISELGVEGDHQADRKHHGGPLRALCLYSVEILERLRKEGHPVGPGAVGENVTTAGLPLDELEPGDRLRIGPMVEIEITERVPPCKTIAHCFRDGRFVRISERTHPSDTRLYARVLHPGSIKVGDPIIRLDEIGPKPYLTERARRAP